MLVERLLIRTLFRLRRCGSSSPIKVGNGRVAAVPFPNTEKLTLALRTSRSALAGISERRGHRTSSGALNEIQVVVCFVQGGLLEFLANAFRITRQNHCMSSKFSCGIRDQRIH